MNIFAQRSIRGLLCASSIIVLLASLLAVFLLPAKPVAANHLDSASIGIAFDGDRAALDPSNTENYQEAANAIGSTFTRISDGGIPGGVQLYRSDQLVGEEPSCPLSVIEISEQNGYADVTIVRESVTGAPALQYIDTVEPSPAGSFGADRGFCVGSQDASHNNMEIITSFSAVTAAQLQEVIAEQATANNPSEEEAAAAAEAESDCLSQTGAPGWLVCPIILTAADAAEGLTDFIVDQLKLDTDALFNDADTSSAYRTAWEGFRNISYALLVIFGLAMAAAQVFNLELFSSYTIRKMLPGLIIAVILVTLSWDIMEFLYNFSNDAADAVMEIIRTPFEQVGSVRDAIEATGRDLSLGTAIIRILQFFGLAAGATVGAATYIAIGGWGVVLSLIASLALFLFSIFVLLAARNVMAFLMVIIAPFAIMCRAFEPLQKVSTFWWSLVLIIIATVPGVAGILTLAGVAALIAAADGGAIELITAFIILIAGIALVWTLFIQFDKITGYAGNVASRVTGRAQEGLSNYRKNAMKTRAQQAMLGERHLFGQGTSLQRGLSNFTSRQLRRAHLANQPGAAAFGSRFRAAEQNLLQQTAAKKLEAEGGRWSGDDDLMGILADTDGAGRDRSSAVAAYTRVTQERALDAAEQAKGAPLTAAERAAAMRKGQQDAIDGVDGAQASFGAPVGSRLMGASAYKAKVASVSAYNGEEFEKLETEEGVKRMYQQLMMDIVPKVSDGTMSITDAVNAIKKNTQRMDLAGHSFPQMMQQIAVSLSRYEQGARGAQLITDGEIDKWRSGSIQYSQAGAQIAGRTEAVKVQSQQELKQIRKAEQDRQAAQTRLDPGLLQAYTQAEAQFSIAQSNAAKAVTDQERIAARTQVEQAQQALVQSQQQLEATPAYTQFRAAEDEVDKLLASFSVKHDQMGYASKENREWYERLLLGEDIPGGGTVMSRIEQRRSSPTFQRLHKEYTQSYGASTQAYLAQQQVAAAAAAAGQPPGQPPAGVPGGIPSDRWLKRDISFVGTTKQNAINLYRFKYLWDDQEYVGVMAQEILATHPQAVITGPDGYYRVDYNALGIPFQTYEAWQEHNPSRPVNHT